MSHFLEDLIKFAFSPSDVIAMFDWKHLFSTISGEPFPRAMFPWQPQPDTSSA